MRSELTTGWVRKRTSFSAQLGDGRRTSARPSPTLQHGLQGIGAKVGDLVLQGFLGRQREELALFDDTGDLHVRVDHRLGEERAAACGSRRWRETPCARRTPSFSATGCAARAGLPDLHRRGGADGSAVGHDDLLGGQSDKSACRDRSLVYKGHRPNPRIQQRIADQHRRIHPPAEGIDLENNGGGTYIVSSVKDALNERREPKVDDSLDGRDVNHGVFCAKVNVLMPRTVNSPRPTIDNRLAHLI